jgi:Tfp pilus assembly protein PilN
MKNIDFLPQRYHESDIRRKVVIWRCVLLLSFGGVLSAATIGQFALKRSAQERLSAQKESYQQAHSKTLRIAALQQQLEGLQEQAALYTYLQHPWPRTQLLVSIARDLPEAVTLQELQFSNNKPKQSSRGMPNALIIGGNNAGADSEPAGAAKKDLQQLRTEHDDARTAIHIKGTTTDTAALNAYVSALGQLPLFESASLASLESVNQREKEDVSQFRVQILVRPGYGQADGPTKPLVEADQLASARTENSHE